MAIEVVCPNPGCAKAYRLKDEMAGKKVRCRQCQSAIEVPADGAAASSDDATTGLMLEGQDSPSAHVHHPARLTCTNCGAVLGVRDATCPQCGGDVRSGVTIMNISREEKERHGLAKLFLGAGAKPSSQPQSNRRRGRVRSRRTVAPSLVKAIVGLIVLGLIAGGVWFMKSRSGGDGGGQASPPAAAAAATASS